jgi:hypothetical protein
MMGVVSVADRLRDLSALFDDDPITLTATITTPAGSFVPKARGQALSISPTELVVRVWFGYHIYCGWTRCGPDWIVTEVVAADPSGPYVRKALSGAGWQLHIGSYR